MSREKFQFIILTSILILTITGWLSGENQNCAEKKNSQEVQMSFYELKSKFLVFTIGLQDNQLLHRAITNRIIHHTNYLEGEEFIIWLNGKKILARDFEVEKIESFPEQLSFFLKHTSAGLKARLDFNLSGSGAVVEKKLFLRTNSRKKLLNKICLVDVRMGREGEFTTFPGLGQPAYKGNLFFGIIYPLSEVSASGLELKVCYEPTQWLEEKGYLSYVAFVGVSEPDQTEKWFFQYLEEFRHRKPEPYLLYNSWYDMPGTVNAQGVRQAIEGFKNKLVEPYGIKLEAIVIDDGWDNPKKLWQLDAEKFPQGIAPLKADAEAIGAKPGMWFSPAGGYAERKYQRLLGTLGQGYEKNWLSLDLIQSGYCPAGDDYHLEFKKRIQEMTSQGVTYFKLDNIGTTCFIPWHHHPPGKFSKTAITNALISVMEEAHQLNPEVYFNITVGTWLSPFWLKWADCVWMGGMDYGFSGPGSPREKNITYKDQNLYNIFRVKNYQFPLNAIMTHGVIKGKYQFPETGPIEEFERDVIMYFGRGVSMWELYLSPDIVTDQEWSVLARWIKWAKQNWQILQNTKMVLGDPNKLEIYGYLHQTQEQALLLLRNPSNKTQSLSLFPEQLGIKNFNTVTQEYPQSENLILQNTELKMNFKPFAVKIIRCTN